MTAQTRAEDCLGCHLAEVREWRQSRHSKAFTNGLFRGEWGQNRTAWCASCHAPGAANPRTVRDDDLMAQEGVGCMACHLDDAERFVSRHKAASSPHETVVLADFGSATSCEGCHEFAFPIMGEDGMPLGFRELAMQETVSQFRASPVAAQGGDCRQCHMKASKGRHAFPGSHDLETLQSALLMESCRSDEVLRIELTNVGAAHSVPTGGVYRHIVLRSWRSLQPERMKEFFIGRRFGENAEGGKTLTVDTTLAVAETRHYDVDTSSLGGTVLDPINIELRYIYLLDEFAPRLPGTRRTATVFEHRAALSQLPACGRSG